MGAGSRHDESLKTDLSDEKLKLIVEALEHYYAYHEGSATR